MPNKLVHFSIEADDVARAKAFYEQVFGWSFSAWGPPNFYRINGAGVYGALQERREPLPEGRKGFELTFAIDDIDATVSAINKTGGRADGERYTIPSVGIVTAFTDTEGNAGMIMQYEPQAMQEMGLM